MVIGAGYGGMVSGAILARNGLNTLLIDDIDQVGGKSAESLHDGYRTFYGHRDAKDHGIGQLWMPREPYCKKAADAAGADIVWEGVVNPLVKLHTNGKVVAWQAGQGFEETCTLFKEVFGLTPDLVQKFLDLVGSITPEDREKLRYIALKDWFPTIDERLHEVFIVLAHIAYVVPAEETSVGRLLDFMAPSTHSTYVEPHGTGLQGFMEAHADAMKRHGGQIELNMKPFQLMIRDGSVQGVVARGIGNEVRVYEAPTVVFAQPIWEILDLVEPGVLSQEFVDRISALPQYDGDVYCVNLGLSRLPTLRSTGEVDTYKGFHRLNEGGYGGGFCMPSLNIPGQAPEGKHIMFLGIGTVGSAHPDKALGPFHTLKHGLERVAPLLEYVDQYYSDLDSIVEWRSDHLMKAPTTPGFGLKTYPRAPIRLPNVDGVFCVGSTTDVKGYYHDIQANAAMTASKIILEDRGIKFEV